jgi:hypothetical protein
VLTNAGITGPSSQITKQRTRWCPGGGLTIRIRVVKSLSHATSRRRPPRLLRRRRKPGSDPTVLSTEYRVLSTRKDTRTIMMKGFCRRVICLLPVRAARSSSPTPASPARTGRVASSSA